LSAFIIVRPSPSVQGNTSSSMISFLPPTSLQDKLHDTTAILTQGGQPQDWNIPVPGVIGEADAATGQAWAEFDAVLPAGDTRQFAGRAQLLPTTRISVISDIDDTIKISEVPRSAGTGVESACYVRRALILSYSDGTLKK
jgi:hypothetical protein